MKLTQDLPPGATDAQKTVSVIIPMYNARHTVLETLKGLEQQGARNFEVVVVDDGSTDPSPSLVTQFSGQSTLRIKLAKEENSGPARARNLGVQNSSGEIIIFLDSDCIPPPGWIEAMTRPLSGNVVGCNCGYRVQNKDKLIARYIDYEIARRHQKMVGRNIDTIGAYSASFVKSVFLKAGGFSTQFSAADAEDFDLAFNIRKMGYNLFFVGDTFVYHYHPGTLKRYLRQQSSRGYWRVKLYLRNKDKLVKGDGYTGYEAQLQFILCNLLLLSIPLMFFSPYAFPVAAGILLLSNLPLGLWAFRREKKFLVLAPVISTLRSLAGTLGVYKYMFQGLKLGCRRLTRAWSSQ